MTKITVVLTCNEHYAMPLATAIRSLVEANQPGKTLDIFVLTSDFSPAERQKVENSLPTDSASIHWLSADMASFGDFSPPAYMSKMTYVRLLLPQFFPESISRVLYLDGDILVLGDLKPLWEMDLKGAVFGAAMDTFSEFNAARLGMEAKPKIGDPGMQELAGECEYFNAGVLLVDLARWRQENISEKALEYMIRNPRTPLADQDALNMTCRGLWEKLDLQWNFQDHDCRGYSAMRPDQRPSIVHFAGKWKPWNATNPSPNARFYDAFRQRTQFARTPAERARDTVQRNWALSKRFLKQYKLLSHIHSYFARPKTADAE